MLCCIGNVVSAKWNVAGVRMMDISSHTRRVMSSKWQKKLRKSDRSSLLETVRTAHGQRITNNRNNEPGNNETCKQRCGCNCQCRFFFFGVTVPPSIASVLSFFSEEHERMKNVFLKETKQEKKTKWCHAAHVVDSMFKTHRVHDDEEVASEVLFALG